MADQEVASKEVQTTNEQLGSTNVQKQVVREKVSEPRGVVAQRVVWYITGVIVALLVLRVIFLLMGANQGNGFVDFLYGLSGFFASPFYGMFSYQPTYGVSTFEVSSLVAIVIYGLVGMGVAKLFTLGGQREV